MVVEMVVVEVVLVIVWQDPSICNLLPDPHESHMSGPYAHRGHLKLHAKHELVMESA